MLLLETCNMRKKQAKPIFKQRYYPLRDSTEVEVVMISSAWRVRLNERERQRDVERRENQRHVEKQKDIHKDKGSDRDR